MKRFLALVVMIAMLTSTAAVAERAGKGRHGKHFTPSVSGKGAPRIARGRKPGGGFYAGIIRNSKISMKIFVSDEDFIEVTAVMDLETIQDETIRNCLELAYEAIREAENVGKLLAMPSEGTVSFEEPLFLAELLDQRLGEMNAELTYEDLVVKDLFYMDVSDQYQDLLNRKGSELEVSFVANADFKKPFVVIFSEDGVHWKVLSAEEAVVNKDGTVTVKLQKPGVMAFLVEGETTIDSETAVQSPD